MNIKETLEKVKKNVVNLNFNSIYGSGNTDKPYSGKNLISLKDAVKHLSDIPFLENQVKILNNSKLFDNYRDEDIFTSNDNTLIQNCVTELRIGLNFLLNYYYSSNININTDDVINIKFPEIENFEDLSRLSNELKRAIEIPINESNTGGKVNIITAENGSIWLVVSLGVFSAVNLIAGICWAAAVIRKKNAEAKMFEAHAKTLDLKNSSLETLVEAQKEQVNNILNAEAEAILSKYYDHKDPETLNRLKLSVSTIADLIDRGVKILPNSESENVKNIFPDYNNLNLITSSIKQLKGE
jgi:DNA-binding TFAR19-related protein (PDSD5 family)